jgi:hypothetical protein
MHPLRFRISTCRKSISAVSAWNERFDAHPLIAVVRLRGRVRAVPRDQGVAEVHGGARRAQVAGWTRSPAQSTEQLYFERDGKVLVQPHALGRLAVNHDAVVAERPRKRGSRTRHLVADETVFDRDEIIREGLLVEEA